MDVMEESFSSQEKTEKAFENLADVMKEVITKATSITETGKIDQKAISLMYKQISLTTNLAKEENYEVPVMIGEELTSINLKIIHQSKEKGKLFISTNTDVYGKLMAEFSVTKEETKGYIMAEKEEAKEILTKMAAHMELNLSENGTVKVNIDIMINKTMKLNSLENQELTNNEEKTVATAELYGVAKTFLRMIQEE
jgi:hypothetical protein